MVWSMMLHLHEYWYKSNLNPIEYNECKISKCIKKRYIIIASKEKSRIKEIIEEMGLHFNKLRNIMHFKL